jgi:hypothetical protein
MNKTKDIENSPRKAWSGRVDEHDSKLPAKQHAMLRTGGEVA